MIRQRSKTSVIETAAAQFPLPDRAAVLFLPSLRGDDRNGVTFAKPADQTSSNSMNREHWDRPHQPPREKQVTSPQNRCLVPHWLENSAKNVEGWLPSRPVTEPINSSGFNAAGISQTEKNRRLRN